MLADYHIHLENGPLTMDYLMQFVKTAGIRGLSEIGFSEHAYNFVDTSSLWPPEWNLKPKEKIADYIGLITTAKKAGLPVKLGIEMDYIEGKENEIGDFLNTYAWDYVIGSVHHIGAWGFDHPDYAEQWNTTDIMSAYKEYFRLFAKAAKTGLFDVMAHADVIKVFGHRPQFTIEHLWEEAAGAMAAGKVAVEINTAGLRFPAEEIYPTPRFLQVCYTRKVPITISSDAHWPNDVGRHFAQASSLAQLVGYNCIHLYTQRRSQPTLLT